MYIPYKFKIDINKYTKPINKNGKFMKLHIFQQMYGTVNFNMLIVLNNVPFAPTILDELTSVHNKTKLLKISKLHILCEMNNLYRFQLDYKKIKYHILFNKTKKNIDDILIYIYILSNDNFRVKYSYAIFKLLNMHKDSIIGLYRIRYIQKGLYPKKVKLIREPKSMEDEYKVKYDSIKKYDNFNHFNKYFEKEKKKSLNYLKNINKDAKFKKFKKKYMNSYEPYKFDMKLVRNNRFYYKGIEKKLDKCRKDIESKIN